MLQENLTTKFFANKQKACLYLLTLPWEWHIHQLNCQNTEVCVVKLPFLMTKGSRVLEKQVNKTQVSKTVFLHLNSSIAMKSKLMCMHL